MVIPIGLSKWLRFGTGVGIVASEHSLEVVVAKVRPTGARVAGELRIDNLDRRQVSEWGAEVGRFLAACGAQSAAALVVLPRERIVVRTVVLPGVSDTDAVPALAYQLENLHPWPEDEVVWSWQRVGQTSSFSVAIAQREIVDHFAALFSEAGIRLAGFTCSASAVYLAARLGDGAPADGTIAVRGLYANLHDAGVEVYAESAARPFYSALLAMPAERAVSYAASEARLEDGAVAVDWIDILPGWASAPDTLDLSNAGRSRLATGWAAALVSACSHLGAPLNLLPAELRVQPSRLALAPALVLAVVLLGLCGALLGEDAWLDKGYMEKLSQQIRLYNPLAKKVEVLDRRIADSATRIKLLDDFRAQTRDDLEALLELTRKIPPPALLDTLSITSSELQLSGETDQAEGLLKTLDESPLFEASEFTSQVSRRGEHEYFRIRTKRERHKLAPGAVK